MLYSVFCIVLFVFNVFSFVFGCWVFYFLFLFSLFVFAFVTVDYVKYCSSIVSGVGLRRAYYVGVAVECRSFNLNEKSKVKLMYGKESSHTVCS